MDREERLQKKNKQSVAWISITVLLSMLIVYTVYHVFSGAGGIKTTPTGYAEQTRAEVLSGVIFRNEEPMDSTYSGDVRYYFSDGERVSNDSRVAEVYSNNSGKELSEQIDRIKDKIDILRKSNDTGIVSITDIEKLDARIERIYAEIYRAIAENDFSKVGELERELLISLNKKKIYDGSVTSYKNEIDALEKELDGLYASFGGESDSVIASEGGYFYRSCDGYERELTLGSVSAMSAEELDACINAVKDKPVKENSHVGKMVYDYKWYIACVCDRSLISLLEAGKSYTVKLFSNEDTETEITLESIGEGSEDRAALIFSCSVMPEGFSYGRYQSFEIMISSYYGYRVPSGALQRITDGESGEEITGVYILNASVVYFKKVSIVAECDGYYIVEEQDKSLENYKEYLSLNDLIIISGEDLYDGKVIDK